MGINIFSKIFKYLKNFFAGGREKELLLDSGLAENNNSNEIDVSTFEQRIYNFINSDYEYEDCDYAESDDFIDKDNKIKIFKLYGDIKSNMRTIDSLDAVELVQINALLKEEEKIKKN